MSGMRSYHKGWQDKRPGFTHRVRWYQGPPGMSIRLKFDTPQGKVSLFYDTEEAAQADFEAFARDELGFWQLMEKKG
jgi:hypothetical protein